jgi:hypothetical protein
MKWQASKKVSPLCLVENSRKPQLLNEKMEPKKGINLFQPASRICNRTSAR